MRWTPESNVSFSREANFGSDLDRKMLGVHGVPKCPKMFPNRGGKKNHKNCGHQGKFFTSTSYRKLLMANKLGKSACPNLPLSASNPFRINNFPSKKPEFRVSLTSAANFTRQKAQEKNAGAAISGVLCCQRRRKNGALCGRAERLQFRCKKPGIESEWIARKHERSVGRIGAAVEKPQSSQA